MTDRAGGGQPVAGTVPETLPNVLYRVRLDGGPTITAHIDSRVDRNFLRLLVGERVHVELSPMDTGRGRIVRKP